MDHLDQTLFWELFQETGDPMGYVLYATQAREDRCVTEDRAIWMMAQNADEVIQLGEQQIPEGCC